MHKRVFDMNIRYWILHCYWYSWIKKGSHSNVWVVVSGEVDPERVRVRLAHFLIDLDNAVVLGWLRRLYNRAHRWQRRHVPLDMTARVIHRGFDEATVVLHVQDAEFYLIVLIWCAQKRKGKSLHRQKNGIRSNFDLSCQSCSTHFLAKCMTIVTQCSKSPQL